MAFKTPNELVNQLVPVEQNKSSNIDKYLNPRTKKVYNHQKSQWEERPVKWNRMVKLPDDNEELMGINRFDLEDKYGVNGIDIDLGNGWKITDDYGSGYQVTRNGEPWKQFKKGGLQNETEVIDFNSIKDVIDFYNKNK